MENKMVDIHSHIVFQVDDGSKHIKESLALLRESAKQGVGKVIATPHYQKRSFPYDKEKIFSHFQALKEAGNTWVPDLELYLGMEIFCDRDAEQIIDKREFFTMNHTDYIMVEFFPNVGFQEMYQQLHEFLRTGYFPVLAHVERYENLSLSKVDRLIESGVYLQVNAANLLGPVIDLGQGREVRKRAKSYVKEEMVHFISSDMHDPIKRRSCMKEAREKVKKWVSKEVVQRMFTTNGDLLIQGIEI